MAGRFTHINEAFTCDHCGKFVPKRSSSCRNHCPYCLTSKHVDIYPGDRANPCQGLMDAVSFEYSEKKGLVLQFVCRSCGAQTQNIAAMEDEHAPDEWDRLLKARLIPRR